MTTFIKIPFASSGDKTNPPDTDAAGGVNWTQGYPIAYSRDPATDPSAKRIEREYMNGLFNRLSTAINEIQTSGIAPFITSADNGGSAFAYSAGALVSKGSKLYISVVDANTTVPPGDNWAEVPYYAQTYSDILYGLSVLPSAPNKMPYFTGVNLVGQTDLTPVGRNIIGKTSITDVLTYLGVKTAGLRDVGTGPNQIPDMSSFVNSFASNGYSKLPGGLIIQWANSGPLVGNSSAFLSFPISFPNQLLVAVPYIGSTIAAQNLGVSIKYETSQSVTLFASTNLTSTSCGAISIGY